MRYGVVFATGAANMAGGTEMCVATVPLPSELTSQLEVCGGLHERVLASKVPLLSGYVITLQCGRHPDRN